MVELQNRTVVNEMSEKIKESNLNLLPRDISNSIQPVIEVGKNIDQHFSKSASQATTGTITIFTTPSDKDFFMTCCNFSFAKDSTCDIGTGVIDFLCVINGATVRPLRSAVITTTAERGNLETSFSTPIKLDRNSVISLTGTFTVGVMARVASINGFTVDTLEK